MSVLDANGRRIMAFLPGPENIANCRLIVAAVNARHGLLAALEDASAGLSTKKERQP